jgi:hypothetical protein
MSAQTNFPTPSKSETAICRVGTELVEVGQELVRVGESLIKATRLGASQPRLLQPRKSTGVN